MAGEDSSSLPASPETIARTLRAVAADLEHAAALVGHAAASIAAISSPAATPAPESPSAGATVSHDGRPAQAGGAKPPQAARKRAARAFTPSLVTGISPDLGPGIPDPFALARRLGPDGLRAALAELRRGTLRAMIREHGIAPAAQVARISDDAKLREMILAAVLK